MMPAFGSSTLDIYVCMWQFDLVFSVASWECAFWLLQLPQSISLLLYIAIKVITWDPTHTGVKFGTRKFSTDIFVDRPFWKWCVVLSDLSFASCDFIPVGFTCVPKPSPTHCSLSVCPGYPCVQALSYYLPVYFPFLTPSSFLDLILPEPSLNCLPG